MLAAAMKSSFQDAVSGAVVQAVAAMPKPAQGPHWTDTGAAARGPCFRRRDAARASRAADAAP